eukprot:gene10570-11711_t
MLVAVQWIRLYLLLILSVSVSSWLHRPFHGGSLRFHRGISNNRQYLPLHQSASSTSSSQDHPDVTATTANTSEITNNSDSSKAEILASLLKGTCIYLVGMMGCGKTTIGKELANSLGYRFLDTDELAEWMIEMPITQFFKETESGESVFRDVEHTILSNTCQHKGVVFSTGGGIVLRNENWGLLRHGIVVFIDVPPEDIYARLMSKGDAAISTRPLLQGDQPLEKLKDLLSQRIEKYEQADVHITVPGTATPEEVNQNIIDALVNFIKSNPPLWQVWKQRRETGTPAPKLPPEEEEENED